MPLLYSLHLYSAHALMAVKHGSGSIRGGLRNLFRNKLHSLSLFLSLSGEKCGNIRREESSFIHAFLHPLPLLHISFSSILSRIIDKTLHCVVRQIATHTHMKSGHFLPICQTPFHRILARQGKCENGNGCFLSPQPWFEVPKVTNEGIISALPRISTSDSIMMQSW